MKTTPCTPQELDGLRAYIKECCGANDEIVHCEAFGCKCVARLLSNIETLEREVSMLRREVSREAELKYKLRAILSDREKFLAEQREADNVARAANTKRTTP